METWRIIAAVLLGAIGVPFVLIVMAKARDHGGGTSGRVAIAGAVTFTILLLAGVLILTVLPGVLTWGIVVVLGAVLGVGILAS